MGGPVTTSGANALSGPMSAKKATPTPKSFGLVDSQFASRNQTANKTMFQINPEPISTEEKKGEDVAMVSD